MYSAGVKVLIILVHAVIAWPRLFFMSFVHLLLLEFYVFICFLLIYRVCPLGTLLSSFIPSVKLSLFFSLSSSFSLSPPPALPLHPSLPSSLPFSFLPSSLPSLSVQNNTWVAQTVKNLPPMWETRVWSLGLEDPLGKGMSTHSSTFAWKTPGTEESEGLQSMGLHRTGLNDQHFHFHTF